MSPFIGGPEYDQDDRADEDRQAEEYSTKSSVGVHERDDILLAADFRGRRISAATRGIGQPISSEATRYTAKLRPLRSANRAVRMVGRSQSRTIPSSAARRMGLLMKSKCPKDLLAKPEGVGDCLGTFAFDVLTVRAVAEGASDFVAGAHSSLIFAAGVVRESSCRSRCHSKRQRPLG
jgi:hypothetical protein